MTQPEEKRSDRSVRKYDFKSIETKWQERWEASGLYRTPETSNPADKFYLLVMFAYPSGDIHMGHFRNYSIGDAVARRQMMLGKSVLHPFGWDAFGLPAERAAISRGIHPQDWTYSNIAISRATLQKVGISYDWEREVASSDPDYYKWTQWMFLKLFEHKLAYQKRGFVNWCPEDKTVLANEQVKDGKCDRCGSLIEKREQLQWYFAITTYADRLIDDLELLPAWPDNVKTMQREWIGRSHGLEIDFPISGTSETLTVFTTRPDTVYGVTFAAISPESELIARLPLPESKRKEIASYQQASLLKSEIERSSTSSAKDGINTGLVARNPFSGEDVQLWVADYVLGGYGTGAVMGVPAHDERDAAFAQRYAIPVKVVIEPIEAATTETTDKSSSAYTQQGRMIHSGPFDGKIGPEGGEAVMQFAELNGIGRSKVNYKLKDWSISRQRYWGCPIPIIHCPACGAVPVPEKDLPILLPKVDQYVPKGRSPLADSEDYMQTTCPACGGSARRDPDTMDTFVCSSWYFLRYIDPKNNAAPFSKEAANCWMPIDLYIGGITHATGHLIYFRFFTKFLHDIGWLAHVEPATRLFNHGMVADSKGEVMSKSKGNVVSPIDLMDKRGVDITRLAMFFTAPSDQPVMWSSDSITGVEKFVWQRFYPLIEQIRTPGRQVGNQLPTGQLQGYERDIYVSLNQTIKKINDDSERLQFNTVVSALMELVRDFDSSKIATDELNDRIILSAIQLIAPLAPHLAEEMWELAGQRDSVFRSTWPKADLSALVTDSVEIAVQVNGKLRDSIRVPRGSEQAIVEAEALQSEKVAQHLSGKKRVKTIFVAGRLINFVVAD